MHTDSTPEFTDAEADFVRRGLGNPDTGALAGGVSGTNWILDRWREAHPLLSFRAFLREFVAVIGPAARARADLLGWPDIWHMPMTLTSRDEAAKTETYEVDDDVWAAAQANRVHIFDARALEIIERLRWEFRAQPVYDAIKADPPVIYPATLPMTPERRKLLESVAEAVAARQARELAEAVSQEPTLLDRVEAEARNWHKAAPKRTKSAFLRHLADFRGAPPKWPLPSDNTLRAHWLPKFWDSLTTK